MFVCWFVSFLGGSWRVYLASFWVSREFTGFSSTVNGNLMSALGSAWPSAVSLRIRARRLRNGWCIRNPTEKLWASKKWTCNLDKFEAAYSLKKSECSLDKPVTSCNLRLPPFSHMYGQPSAYDVPFRKRWKDHYIRVARRNPLLRHNDTAAMTL